MCSVCLTNSLLHCIAIATFGLYIPLIKYRVQVITAKGFLVMTHQFNLFQSVCLWKFNHPKMQYNKLLYWGLQLLTICTLCDTGMKNARNVYKKSFLCYKHSRLKQKERREQRNNYNRYNCMTYIGREWVTLTVTFLWSCSCNCVRIATLIHYI